MLTRCLAATLLTITVAGLGATAPAGADDRSPAAARGTAGWTKVSKGEVAMLSEIAVARTSDGVVHAVYAQDSGPTMQYEHAALSTTNQVVAHSLPVGPWAALIYNMKLEATPGGLRLFFSGLQDTNTGNFYSSGRMYDATSDASGAAFTLQPHALTKSSTVYAGYGIAMARLASGTTVVGSVVNSSMVVRAQPIESTDLNTINAAPGDAVDSSYACCLYDLGMTASGETAYAAWHQNGPSESSAGTFVRQVYPTYGQIAKAPFSSEGANGVTLNQSAAIVTRPSDGHVILAYKIGYPTTTHIGLWDVTTNQVVKVRADEPSRVALSASPSGRLWLAWADADDDVHAARTSVNSLTLGAANDFPAPGGADTAIWHIAIEGSMNQGVVLVNDDASHAVWSRLVNPALSLKLKPTKVKVGAKTTVKAVVTDAGTPVAGVKVKFGKASCNTNARGICTEKIVVKKPKKAITVVASKSGYASAKAKIKVKK